MTYANEDTAHVQKVLNVTEGEHFTIYHESLKDVTFCAVSPPFFPTDLRAGFGNDRADWNLDLTMVSR